MLRKNPESRFVRKLLARDNEGAIEEATRKWFDLIRILDRIAAQLDTDASDSPNSGEGDRVTNADDHV